MHFQTPITPMFLLASLAIIVSPGPDILFVITKGLLYGRRPALLAPTGFCSGLSVHTTLAVTGISGLLRASATDFMILKIFGAAYLAYLGIQAWRTSAGASLARSETPNPSHRVFLQAFLMNVSNPKVILFFLAFLPQFANPANGPLPHQFLILGITFAILSWAIFSLCGYFSASLSRWFEQSPGSGRVLHRVTGSIFLLIAVRLLFIR